MKRVTKTVGFAAALVVTASTCTSLPGGSPGSGGLGDLPMPTLVLPDTTPCEGLLTSLDCAVVTERIQIARAEGTLRRGEDEVCVSGRGLADFCLADEPGGRRFYLGSLQSPPIHLFFKEDGDDGRMVAVGAREPNETEVDGIPRPSPDGRFAAVAALDLGPSGLNRFRIHAVRNDSLPVVFEVEPTDWGPGRPTWITAEAVRFPMITPLTQGFRGDLVADSVTVMLREGEWILVPPSGR